MSEEGGGEEEEEEEEEEVEEEDVTITPSFDLARRSSLYQPKSGN